MLVKVGQLLWYKNKFTGNIESVLVKSVESSFFGVAYKGKEFSQSYDKIGKVFFYAPDLVDDPNIAFERPRRYKPYTKAEMQRASYFSSHSGSLVYDYSSSQEHFVSEICKECVSYEDNACKGSYDACDEYRPIDWQDDRIDEWSRDAENDPYRKW